MRRRFAALAAMLGIALQALWPLIAHARPVLSVPVCSYEAPGHSIEIPVGKGEAAGEHCAQCVVGTGDVAVLRAVVFALPAEYVEKHSGKEVPGLKPLARHFAHPRAPPAVS